MKYLPIEPLLAEIEKRGGLTEILDRRAGATPRSTQRSSSWGDEPEYPEIWKTAEYLRLYRALNRGKEQTFITDRWADAFCCTYLKVHPGEVFGQAYWDLAFEEDDVEMEDAA